MQRGGGVPTPCLCGNCKTDSLLNSSEEDPDAGVGERLRVFISLDTISKDIADASCNPYNPGAESQPPRAWD